MRLVHRGNGPFLAAQRRQQDGADARTGNTIISVTSSPTLMSIVPGGAEGGWRFGQFGVQGRRASTRRARRFALAVEVGPDFGCGLTSNGLSARLRTSRGTELEGWLLRE